MDRSVLSALNAAATPLVSGEVVRVSADQRATRAFADVAAHVQGTIGVVQSQLSVAPNRRFTSVIGGFVREVLLEPGLAPAAGQTLYVSGVTAGQATNVAPALAFPIGIIFDASIYALTQRVRAVVALPAASGGFPGPGASVKTITFADSPYAVLATDWVLEVDATAGIVVVNLPASASGQEFRFKKIDDSIHMVRLMGLADGLNEQDLAAQWDELIYVGDGAAYLVF